MYLCNYIMDMKRDDGTGYELSSMKRDDGTGYELSSNRIRKHDWEVVEGTCIFT